jgi:CRP/FNR family cyclic AMP-dependent transcriptional regulator
MKDFWHLHGFDWLAQIDNEQTERLRRASARRTCAPGETIFAPKPEPQGVYLLESGRVRVFRLSPDGSETTFGYVTPGEVFGELSVFADGSRESFAQAVEPSTIWRVPRDVFQQLIREVPQLVFEVTKQIGQRMKRIESRVENLVFRDAQARLAGILLELGEDFGHPDGDRIQLDLPLTQSEIGTLIGSSRQTVNACLGELEASGLVTRGEGTITIVKPDELQRAAGMESGR